MSALSEMAKQGEAVAAVEKKPEVLPKLGLLEEDDEFEEFEVEDWDASGSAAASSTSAAGGVPAGLQPQDWQADWDDDDEEDDGDDFAAQLRYVGALI
jgi:26 proteasome complex subunit DSS1